MALPTVTIPNIIAAQPGGDLDAALLDQNWDEIADALNAAPGVAQIGDAMETGTWGTNLAGGTRVATTIYQNTSGRKRRVSIVVIGAGAAPSILNYAINVGAASPPTLTIVDNRVQDATGVPRMTAYVEVPNQHFYQLAITTGTLNDWHELDE